MMTKIQSLLLAAAVASMLPECTAFISPTPLRSQSLVTLSTSRESSLVKQQDDTAASTTPEELLLFNEEKFLEDMSRDMPGIMKKKPAYIVRHERHIEALQEAAAALSERYAVEIAELRQKKVFDDFPSSSKVAFKEAKEVTSDTKEVTHVVATTGIDKVANAAADEATTTAVWIGVSLVAGVLLAQPTDSLNNIMDTAALQEGASANVAMALLWIQQLQAAAWDKAGMMSTNLADASDKLSEMPSLMLGGWKSLVVEPMTSSAQMLASSVQETLGHAFSSVSSSVSSSPVDVVGSDPTPVLTSPAEDLQSLLNK